MSQAWLAALGLASAFVAPSADPGTASAALIARDIDVDGTLARELMAFSNRRPSDLDERIDLVPSARQASESGDLGDRPVVVLTKGAPEELPAPYAERVATAWLAMRQEVASLSTRGVQRTVPGAGHDIQLDQPDAVVQAIEDVLAALSAE